MRTAIAVVMGAAALMLSVQQLSQGSGSAHRITLVGGASVEQWAAAHRAGRAGAVRPALASLASTSSPFGENTHADPREEFDVAKARDYAASSPDEEVSGYAQRGPLTLAPVRGEG